MAVKLISTDPVLGVPPGEGIKVDPGLVPGSPAWAAYQTAGAGRPEDIPPSRPAYDEEQAKLEFKETLEAGGYKVEDLDRQWEIEKREVARAVEGVMPWGGSITESQAQKAVSYYEDVGQPERAEQVRKYYVGVGHPEGFIEKATEIGYGPFAALEDYKVGDSYNLIAAFEAGVVTPAEVRGYFPEEAVSTAIFSAGVFSSLRLGGFITPDGSVNLAGALAAGIITEGEARRIFSSGDVDAALEASGVVEEEVLDYRGLFPHGIGAEVEVEPEVPTAWEKFVAFFREPRPSELVAPFATRTTSLIPLGEKITSWDFQAPVPEVYPGHMWVRPHEEMFPFISGPLLTTTRYWEHLKPWQRALGIGTVALQVAGITSPIWAPRVPLPGPIKGFLGVPKKVPTVEYGLIGKAGHPITYQTMHGLTPELVGRVPPGTIIKGMMTGGPAVRFPVSYPGGIRLPTSQIYQTIPITHFPSAYGELPGFGVTYMGVSVPMQAPISAPGGVSAPIPWGLMEASLARPYWHPGAPGIGYVGPSGVVTAPTMPIVGVPSITVPTTATMTQAGVLHQLAALGIAPSPIVAPRPFVVPEVPIRTMPEPRIVPSVVPGVPSVPYFSPISAPITSVVPSPALFAYPAPTIPTPGVTPSLVPGLIPTPTYTITAPPGEGPPRKPPPPPFFLPGASLWGWKPTTRRRLRKPLGIGVWKFKGFPVAAPHPIFPEVVGYEWMKGIKKPYGIKRRVFKVKKPGGGLVRMTV